MRFALLLLWLTTLAPAAHAADWLTWRRVGEATSPGAVHRLSLAAAHTQWPV